MLFPPPHATTGCKCDRLEHSARAHTERAVVSTKLDQPIIIIITYAKADLKIAASLRCVYYITAPARTNRTRNAWYTPLLLRACSVCEYSSHMFTNQTYLSVYLLITHIPPTVAPAWTWRFCFEQWTVIKKVKQVTNCCKATNMRDVIVFSLLFNYYTMPSCCTYVSFARLYYDTINKLLVVIFIVVVMDTFVIEYLAEKFRIFSRTRGIFRVIKFQHITLFAA